MPGRGCPFPILYDKGGSALDEIIIQAKTREKRWVSRSGGAVSGLRVYRPVGDTLTGNLYIGRVVRIHKGLDAAFVDIGEGKNGYLHAKDCPDNVRAFHGGDEALPINQAVHEGEKLLVQVTKDPTGTKGAKLSAVIELKGEYLVYMPQGVYVAASKKLDEKERSHVKAVAHRWKLPEEGVVLRTSSAGIPEEDIKEEIVRLRGKAEDLRKRALKGKAPFLLENQDALKDDLKEQMKKGEGRILVDDYDFSNELQSLAAHHEGWSVEFDQGRDDIFSRHGVDSAWDRALKKVVWLKNGAYLVIETTEAMTVVDVNSGKFTGRATMEQTTLETNLLAAEETAHQLALRNIGGMILIDFIGMKTEGDRQQVEDAFRTALGADRQRTTVEGFTKLGILEVTRKRARQALEEYLTEPCHACGGTGRTESPDSLAFRLEREIWDMDHPACVSVEGTPDVRAAFSGPGDRHIDRLEARLGVKVDWLETQAVNPFYRITKIQ